MTEELLPKPPEFDYLDWLKARSIGYYEPIFFEWFRFSGQVVCLSYSVSEESEGYRKADPIHLSILRGLLNRCSRLMLAHMALSHQQKFGETTAILDRCIFESALKVRWLCNDATDEKFQRYMCDGLRNDLKLKQEIERNIEGRGSSTAVEGRMLMSIEKYLQVSKQTADSVAQTKNLPNIGQMLKQLGHDNLMYVVNQNLGSHHVHGTWSSLILHYLEPDFEAGTFSLRDHDCMADYNTYAATSVMVLLAVRDFFYYAFPNEENELRVELIGLAEETQSEILSTLTEASETKTRLLQERELFKKA